VLLAEQVVMKTRNDFQMAWYQWRTWGEVALFMIFLTLGVIFEQEVVMLIRW